MTGLLILLAAIFTGCSCYYLSCAFADIPTVRTSKAMMTTRKQTGSGSENCSMSTLPGLPDFWLPLSAWIR